LLLTAGARLAITLLIAPVSHVFTHKHIAVLFSFWLIKFHSRHASRLLDAG